MSPKYFVGLCLMLATPLAVGLRHCPASSDGCAWSAPLEYATSLLTCACAVFFQAAVSRELARLSIEKSPAANAGVLVSCGL